ncbi:MAG: glutamate-1-semialdehyde 2,1-aminomutase [Flavobacteriales bacterium]|jgi:glutamate-1-semialdehyde 2,1-aminomutase|nr:glutamate-1-semialdehyde 2,1-aminomutase [Flavobacteriales bacterium]
MNWSDRLHAAIPGGAHTYSRGDDQYPSNAPPILSHGKGAYVWDAEGKRYLDYGMGLRAVTLGYADERVNAAAIAEIGKGNNLTRPSLTELEAAERMLSLFPWAGMVKFAKNGSIVTTAAVKLARAFTGRTHVAIPAEQPFFTYDDWFIGSTPMDRGIPEEHKRLTLKFSYNDIASVERLFAEHPGRIACVLMEPATSLSPCPASCGGLLEQRSCAGCPQRSLNFLQQVKALCAKHGAVFVLDEMITGFRWDLHGAMKGYDIEPDLATFGKGMANGFALAALIGRREIMELGGIRQAGAERVFLISTTHGSEMSAFGAFNRTVEIYQSEDITGHLWRYGRRLIEGLNTLAAEAGVADRFEAHGFGCSPYYTTRDAQGQVSLPFRTLWSQEMIRGGVLMPWVALSAAHGDAELDQTLTAARKALAVYAAALSDGIDKHLVGPAVKPVFRKHN